MEKYKKKSLNFMGFSRELRTNQRNNQRCISRHQRFSIVRPLDDESISEEKKENNSRNPTTGKPDTQAGSRVELLQKWKQEKIVKKQQESKLKKPAFKVGINKPNPSPSVGNKPLFALDTSSRFYKSSFQASNSMLFGKKQESLNASKAKTSAKISNSQSSAKKTEFDAINIKTRAKDLKIQPSKILAPSKPESKWSKNKESGIQSFSMKPKADATSKLVNKDGLSSIRKQPTITTGISKPLETKKESRLQPLIASSKVTSFARNGKNNIPSSGLAKPTTSRTLSEATDQIPSSGLTKPTTSRTFSKTTDQQIPVKKNVVKSIPKFSKIVVPQQRGNISENTSKPESKLPNKPDSDFKFTSFECELSHIESVKEPRKSFAPEGFMFQPPAELSSSLFLEDGPSAIFMRMKNQFLRTSTPKQSPSSKQFSPKIEDNECLKNEDIESLENENIKCSKKEDTNCSKKEDTNCSKKEDTNCSKKEDTNCSKDEDTNCSKDEDAQCSKDEDAQCSKEEDAQCSNNENSQCSKNTNEEFGPLNKCDFETILSSSLESVVLNDMKLTDCKQSLKFEFPEVIPMQNREEMLLPSKTIHPELSLATEPPPVDEVKRHILLDLVEIYKTEICFTDATSTDDGKTSVLFSKVDSEDKKIPDPGEMARKIQDVANGFLQKQEIGPLKIPEIKNQKFRQSHKPGLASINESLENTPKSALKKKFLDNVFTPRRSLRLGKLSGNFSSLENLPVSPKPKGDKDKAALKESFTPRRSLRLSKFSTEFNSAENLFDVRRPTLYGTPEEDKVVPKLSSRVTYDFDRLSSETEEETRHRTTRSGKVSLLYTPPNKARPSILRHSIKGDLMSFSPNV